MCEGGMMPCAYVLAWIIVALILGYSWACVWAESTLDQQSEGAVSFELSAKRRWLASA